MDKLIFNVSASAVNTYIDSEILFYAAYVAKLEVDTYVTPVYGRAGNVVHETLEFYVKNYETTNGNIQILLNLFEKLWIEKEIPKHKALFGRDFSKKKPDYIKALKRGVKIVDDLVADGYELIAEGEFIFKFLDNDKAFCNLKGYIDLIAKKGDEIIFIDWKTSSSVDTGAGFARQSMMYYLLIYLKYGYLPKESRFYYIKIMDDPKRNTHTLTEIMEFFETIKVLVRRILKQGFDSSKYSMGNWEKNIFNDKRKFCVAELDRRNSKDSLIFNLVINATKIFVDVEDNRFYKILDTKYSYLDENRFFSTLYKRKLWDGKYHLFKNKTLNFGFYNDLLAIIKDYCEYYKKKYKIIITDRRNLTVVDKKFDTKFKDTPFELRYYQKEAKAAAKDKKVGILDCCTATGKSIIAAGLIRDENRMTMLIVNRIELVEQTKAMFENYLGVEVGTIYEGKANYKQINVAGIQSLLAILKRNDETSEKLKLFLYNTTLTIWDEAQNVVDSGMYGEICKYLINSLYFIGLSGTPFRNDCHTLRMNSLVGLPIYSYPYEKAVSDGFIVPVKSYFIENQEKHKITGDYNDVYDNGIVGNEKRNNLIKTIVDKYRHNKKILIITKKINHGKLLNELVDNSHLITGSTKRENRKDWFKEFKESTKGLVLIGSQQIFSTGIDLPDLDIIINAGGGRSEVLLLQTVGRPMRKSPGKICGYFIDFVDYGEYLLLASNDRYKLLQKHKREVEVINSIEMLDIK